MILTPDIELTPHMINELVRQVNYMYDAMNYKGSGLDNERSVKIISAAIDTLRRDSKYKSVAENVCILLAKTSEKEVKEMADLYRLLKESKEIKIKKAHYEAVAKKAIEQVYKDIYPLISLENKDILPK